MSAVAVDWGVDVIAGVVVALGWGVSVGLGGLWVAWLLVGGGGFSPRAANEPGAGSADGGLTGFWAAAACPLTSRVPTAESEMMRSALTGSETPRLEWFVTIASSSWCLENKSPWTSLLQQVHGPNIDDGRFRFRQLAVVAECFSRRPCSFASPPFGGFAFS